MTNIPVFKSEIAVRWSDMDAFGHVNNSVYFTYFEQARVKWWKEIGLRLSHVEEGPVVVTANCTFLKTLNYPAEIEIHVFASPPGRSSYLISYEIYLLGKESVKIAEGSTKIVWINYKKQKSIPLPEIMLKHLPPYTDHE